MALGITLREKQDIYAGVIAIIVSVISQTYQFLFSLPRWLITAAAGLTFLTLAIYLLAKRNLKQNEG